MSRAKGARLWLRPAREDGRYRRPAVWIIRDGDRSISTGCGACEAGLAEKALADFLTKKHDPRKDRKCDPLAARLPDIISVYAEEVDSARPHETARRLGSVLTHFGDVPLAAIDRAACFAYVKARGKQQAARRELEDLRAAINHWFGGDLIAAKINITLPDKALRRETWHTRDELAKLIWTAWRKTQPTPNGGKRYVSKHIARFILVGLYTGTRAAAICGAALRPTIGRGHVDLDRGVFYRRPEGERETTKRKPPARLHPRLLAHIRRWERLGICLNAVVEWNGKPVERVSKGYRAVSDDAGIRSFPHALRHTFITLALQGGADPYETADYAGMSYEVMMKTYGHHHPDFQAGVLKAIGGRR